MFEVFMCVAFFLAATSQLIPEQGLVLVKAKVRK